VARGGRMGKGMNVADSQWSVDRYRQSIAGT
jgi:hypothetical protein